MWIVDSSPGFSNIGIHVFKREKRTFTTKYYHWIFDQTEWVSGQGGAATRGKMCERKDIKAQFLKLPLLNVISYFLKFWQDWNGKINGLQSRLKITFTTLLQHKTQKSLFMEILRRKDSDLKAKTENIFKVIILYMQENEKQNNYSLFGASSYTLF